MRRAGRSVRGARGAALAPPSAPVEPAELERSVVAEAPSPPPPAPEGPAQEQSARRPFPAELLERAARIASTSLGALAPPELPAPLPLRLRPRLPPPPTPELLRDQLFLSGVWALRRAAEIRLGLCLLKFLSYGSEICEENSETYSAALMAAMLWALPYETPETVQVMMAEMEGPMGALQMGAAADGSLSAASAGGVLGAEAVAHKIQGLVDAVDEPEEGPNRRILSPGAASLEASRRRELRSQAIGLVEAAILREYEQGYLVAGARGAYAPDCVFSDPLWGERTLPEYRKQIRQLSRLASDVDLELQDLVVLYPFQPEPSTPLELAASRTVSAEARERIYRIRRQPLSGGYREFDADSAIDAVVLARWELEVTLRLPWRPCVRLSGSTEYDVRVEEEEWDGLRPPRFTAQVAAHRESWELFPAWEGLLPEGLELPSPRP
eukprot:tig00021108_g18322.t1